MTLGLDYAGGRPSSAAIKAAGYGFVCRYLSDGGPDLPGKLLLPDEFDNLLSNDLGVVLNWESTGVSAQGGFAAGVQDANGAVVTGCNIGSPAGSVVYFSIDWDAQDFDTILNYFQGAGSVIGVPATGVYGSYGVVKQCLDAGVASWAWQCSAWSYGMEDPRINIFQNSNRGYAYVDGVQCDIDEARTPNIGACTRKETPK